MTGETKLHMFWSSVKLFYTSQPTLSITSWAEFLLEASIKKCIIHNHYYSVGKITNPTLIMSIIAKNCIIKENDMFHVSKLNVYVYLS